MRPRHANARRRGFTLIELVVVLAILSVAVALVLPAVGRSTQGLRLRGEAGRVAALLREARREAVTARHATRVTLAADGSRVTLAAAGADDASHTLALPPPFRLRVVDGVETLRFSPRGLTQTARWALEEPGGRRLVIGIEALSGRVTIRAESRR